MKALFHIAIAPMSIDHGLKLRVLSLCLRTYTLNPDFCALAAVVALALKEAIQ